MDPLSILGVVIALLGVTSSTVDKVKRIYGAHQECDDLMEDLADAKTLFTEVERSLTERKAQQGLSQETTTCLCSILDSATLTLRELNRLMLAHASRVVANGEKRLGRFVWTRQRPKILALRERLRKSQENARFVCAISSLLPDLTVPLLIHRFSSDLSRIYNKLGQLDQSSRQAIDGLPDRFMTALTASQQAFQPIAHVGPTSVDGRTILPMILNTPSETPDRSSSVRDGPGATSVAVSSERRAPRYRRNRCDKFCSCSCHKLHHVNTPQAAAMVLGWLIVGYSGWSSLWKDCSERRCQRQSIPTIAFAFYFPQWLLARMIHFVFSISYMNGPQVSLATPRVIGGNSEIFTFAIDGNLDGIKALFNQGLASPFDVCESNGRTPLHYAAAYSHRDVARFLIQNGARETVEDKEQATAISLCWAKIFKNLVDQPAVEEWRVLLDDEDFLESRVFPSLHKIVLGVSSLNLQQQLELSTASIDDQDSDGRTALSWAAARSDLPAVKTLLHYGADPNVCSLRGQSALHFAAQNPSANAATIVEDLLQKNAAVNCIDYWRRSALLYAGCNQDEPRLLQLLIDRGADLNVRDCRERTPLGYAARMNKPAVARYLLDRGADKTMADHWGLTPLCEAVWHNHHEILRDLLRLDVAFDHSTLDGMTPIHLVAEHGDGETLRLLVGHTITDFDVSSVNQNGRTAEMLFDEREEVEPALRGAFESLVRNLRSNVRVQELGDDEPESDEEGDNAFVDALEHLIVVD